MSSFSIAACSKMICMEILLTLSCLVGFVFNANYSQKSPNIVLPTGPDICGPSNKKVHVIFNYKGKNHLIKKEIRPKDDVYTHLYTLIVKPDQTYEVSSVS